MDKLYKCIVSFFSTWEERYLNQSVDVADLESRLKNLEKLRSRGYGVV
jgi:hypothetical protein|tara:strand:- start:306 stop:449 length:144 start_codon:yes stop_codon:yes gene_type:complete